MDGINTIFCVSDSDAVVVIPLQMDGINTAVRYSHYWRLVVIPLQMDGINTFLLKICAT